jgi:DNA-binding transcriptional ArsR family regulator
VSGRSRRIAYFKNYLYKRYLIFKGVIVKKVLEVHALEPKLEDAAQLMDMLSHPVRLRLMCMLLGGEESVQHLAETAELSQPAMSHHLKKLRDAELVQTRREGQTIYYSVKSAEAAQVIEVLHRLYCA